MASSGGEGFPSPHSFSDVVGHKSTTSPVGNTPQWKPINNNLNPRTTETCLDKGKGKEGDNTTSTSHSKVAREW